MGRHHLNQLYDLGRKKPVRTDNLIRAVNDAGNESNTQLRCIGGQNSLVRGQRINFRENFPLEFEVFMHSLNDILSIHQGFGKIRNKPQPAHNGLSLDHISRPTARPRSPCRPPPGIPAWLFIRDQWFPCVLTSAPIVCYPEYRGRWTWIRHHPQHHAGHALNNGHSAKDGSRYYFFNAYQPFRMPNKPCFGCQGFFLLILKKIKVYGFWVFYDTGFRDRPGSWLRSAARLFQSFFPAFHH